MLVENKFFFVSLPRGASTAFKEACILSRYDIKHVNSYYDFIYENNKVFQNQTYFPSTDNNVVNNKITNEKVEINTMNFGYKYSIFHPHERLIHLLNKFGDNYPIISIKRNKFHRFVSIFSKIVELLYQSNDFISYDILSKINYKDLFCFESKLIIEEKYELIADIVFDNLKLNKNNIVYIKELLQLLFKPMSHWHGNNDKIIWFDLENIESMQNLENWVSDITKKKFVLHKSNNIKEPISHLLKVDKEFRWLFDNYYTQTENQKNIKTII